VLDCKGGAFCPGIGYTIVKSVPGAIRRRDLQGARGQQTGINRPGLAGQTELPHGKVRGMSQIEELQGRIAAAMERIGAGVTVLSERENGGPLGAEQAAALTTALDEEKLANAQLQERLAGLKTKHADEIAALKGALDNSAEMDKMRTDLEAQSVAMARLDMDVHRLRQANDMLRDSNAALRQANEQGVGEPHLINKAMLAELEGLRAARATDAAEASAVLAKLEPLLADAGISVQGQAQAQGGDA